MTSFHPDTVWIESAEADSALARHVRSRVAADRVVLVDDPRDLPPVDARTGKRSLVLQRHRGRFLGACPAGTPGLICCNYLVVNFASNCPLDCSYCFLQAYLADNGALKAFTNVEDALEEVAAVLRAHPARRFRIGTGELADSLALDPITGLSRIVVPFLAQFPNALLELKTKTDCIDDLLDLDPRERVVVSWSVNARRVSDEEIGAVSLATRLRAARRVLEKGYLIGFHFDPLVEFEGWESGYEEVVEEIFAQIDPRRIAWVSLGSLRLTPDLWGHVRRREKGSIVLGSEMVPCADGKWRVWQGLRLRMYRRLTHAIRRRAPEVPLYLCMEGAGVWEKVLGERPTDRELGGRLAAGVSG